MPTLQPGGAGRKKRGLLEGRQRPLTGDDTPIGAVKHSFIVKHYCPTTTQDSGDWGAPDLSFQIHHWFDFFTGS